MPILRSPIALVFAASSAWFLTGCIPVPGDHKVTDRRERPERLVGRAGSDRPLRISESTLPDVMAWLGLPVYATSGWRDVVYRYEVRAGVLLRAYAPPRDLVSPRFFVVRFAPSGTIESSQVFRNVKEIPEYRRDELHVARRVPSPPAPRGTTSDPS